MNHDEFFSFTDELHACFPMLAKWFIGQDDAVTKKWQSVLAPVELYEAKELLNEWFLRGTQPFREASQWQEVPAMIRRELLNRSAKQFVPDWKKPAYRPSEDSEFLKYSKRLHEVAVRYDNGLGSITLEEAKAEHRMILKEYDAARAT